MKNWSLVTAFVFIDFLSHLFAMLKSVKYHRPEAINIDIYTINIYWLNVNTCSMSIVHSPISFHRKTSIFNICFVQRVFKRSPGNTMLRPNFHENPTDRFPWKSNKRIKRIRKLFIGQLLFLGNKIKRPR